jgi:hypothetical protein
MCEGKGQMVAGMAEARIDDALDALGAGGGQNGTVPTYDDIVLGIAGRGQEQGFDPREIQLFGPIEIHLAVGIG